MDIAEMKAYATVCKNYGVPMIVKSEDLIDIINKYCPFPTNENPAPARARAGFQFARWMLARVQRP
ncbi:hypothetical protein UFOVP1204_32 [uncultured Caudovirales phage]|uniref:Uncharacterized protein n=1 Tax=uncultured Caudovirales phage TaxID=2100421 RepID=A0A6J5MKB1_9CAUD|nr:hypothetical protein UFOVP473_69 [uncultured Caudovirales phage]CAB4176893.1 hypothetical protein UFOVP983_69 [uncultured Caudovirales phage]CAB4189930.1 hypothetical protein UFOVP1204_32 [uncultured Caudovirales phage]